MTTLANEDRQSDRAEPDAGPGTRSRWGRIAEVPARGGRAASSRGRVMREIALGLSVVYLSGCASPGKSVDQVIRVETPGCAIASCTLSNDQGEWHVPDTPGEVSVITSHAPLRLACRAEGGLENSSSTAPTLSDRSGVGALAGGLTGGAAIGAAFGTVALTFMPVIGIAIVATGVALGAASGTAVEASQQMLSYPTVISVSMSCAADGDAVKVPNANRFGVGFRGLSLEELQAQGLRETGAVLVTDVAPGSVGEAAGLRSGDIVLAVNGRALVEVTQFERAALASLPDGPLQLRLWRDGQAIDISIALTSAAR